MTCLHCMSSRAICESSEYCPLKKLQSQQNVEEERQGREGQKQVRKSEKTAKNVDYSLTNRDAFVVAALLDGRNDGTPLDTLTNFQREFVALLCGFTCAGSVWCVRCASIGACVCCHESCTHARASVRTLYKKSKSCHNQKRKESASTDEKVHTQMYMEHTITDALPN